MVDIANMVGLTTTNSFYIRGSSNGLIEDIESHQQEKGLADPISERGIAIGAPAERRRCEYMVNLM